MAKSSMLLRTSLRNRPAEPVYPDRALRARPAFAVLFCNEEITMKKAFVLMLVVTL
jgi:hypothetical protein